MSEVETTARSRRTWRKFNFDQLIKWRNSGGNSWKNKPIGRTLGRRMDGPPSVARPPADLETVSRGRGKNGSLGEVREAKCLQLFLPAR